MPLLREILKSVRERLLTFGNSRNSITRLLTLNATPHGQYSSRDGNVMVIKSLRYHRKEKISRLSMMPRGNRCQ